MKTRLKICITCTMLAFALIIFSSCDDDEDPGPQLTGNSETYPLASVSNPGISGNVTFAERDDDQVLITIQLTGTTSGASHPAHIHATTAAEGGPIVLDLTSVDGATGKSETVVKALNNGTEISYDDLLNYDGYVNVHLSAADLATLVAQGDIGTNALTGNSKVYTLMPVVNPAVTGTATFAERKGGHSLVTVDIEGMQPGSTHPSHIHANTIAETGVIIIDLNPVDGATGVARTTVREYNDGTAVSYEELLEINGYLNVHSGASFVVQGDVGQNELTGDKKEYTLNELNASGVSGVAIFEKRQNGNAQITLDLEGTVEGGDHPAHIHANDAATGGGIVLDLKNVNGATGMSVTSANKLRDDTAITYDELLSYNGHINVHLSPANLATRVAQGNIGSNAP